MEPEVKALQQPEVAPATPIPETAVQRLERALVNAHKAGDTDAARKIAAKIRVARQDKVNEIPGMPVPTKPAPEPSLTDKAIGVGEAALTVGTGATGGTIGMLAGTLKGLAEQILNGEFGTPEAARAVEEAASRGAGAMTYQPRTETGQDYVEEVSVLASNLPPVLPAVPGLAAASAGAGSQIAQGAKRAAAGAKTAAKTVTETVAKTMERGEKAPTPGAQGAAGAAGVDMATLRRARADELPVPMKLTEGEASRNFEQQRFEHETAKDGELGAPLRDRFALHNRQLQQNLDTFIDSTGAEAPDLRSIGLKVDSAIRDRAAKDKSRIRALYKEAEKAGEMQGEANLSDLGAYLNQNRAGRTSAPIMQTVADELQVQGIGGGKLEDGSIKVVAGTLKQAEDIRKSINKFAKSTDPNDLRVAAEMKEIIDRATEGSGGQAYKAARAARAKYARDYEGIALVRSILGKKRGSQDRSIALEDVLNRLVISPSASLDDVRNVRRLLQTEGENGKQAWRELQGGTLRFIKDEATKNVARNEMGDPIVSAAQLDRTIQALDKNGKLDFVFGKKGAEMLRTVNDVAKDVLTVVPGSVNTSHTASVIMALIDTAISGAAGIPAPLLTSARLLSKGVKNAKTKARIKKALGD